MFKQFFKKTFDFTTIGKCHPAPKFLFALLKAFCLTVPTSKACRPLFMQKRIARELAKRIIITFMH